MKKSLGRQITHRGLESSESIYFPPVDRIEDTTGKTGWGNKDKIWSWNNLIEFVFPVNASPKYHEMATKFMEFLCENLQYDDEKLIGITGEDVSRFVKENNFSSSSFYSYVLRKMLHVGLLERRRLERSRRFDTGSWSGRMLLQPSEQFITHLNRIADWNMKLLVTAKENCKKKSSQLARMEVEPNPIEEVSYEE